MEYFITCKMFCGVEGNECLEVAEVENGEVDLG